MFSSEVKSVHFVGIGGTAGQSFSGHPREAPPYILARGAGVC
jgi:hypothetical protein